MPDPTLVEQLPVLDPSYAPGARCAYCWRRADGPTHVFPLFACVEVVARYGGGIVCRLRTLAELTWPGHDEPASC